MTKRTHSKPNNRNGAILLAFAATVTLFVAGGCKAIEEHKCCLFSEDGIFSPKKSEVDRANKNDERDALARAAVASSNKKEAWEETDEDRAKNPPIDLKKYTWTTQRPNGGALFPKQWQGPGPALVVEPATIAAPVGSDVIVVASYIGEDSQFLRVGEELNWSLSGTGKFMESNPNEFANGRLANVGSRLRSESCLSCPLTKNTRDVDDRNMTTTTTGQLWRINRGTDTQLDDVTILRGQSWTSVSSFEEGTSTIVVLSDTIGNWNKRRAVSEIHWVDAAFLFPESGVSEVNTSQNLTTRVCRKTTGEPREGWKVRYRVLSGDAGLGPNREPSVTVLTDKDGNATTTATQLNGVAGTAKILATVFRPATETAREAEIDSKTIFQTWTQNGVVTASLTPSTLSAQPGERIHYNLTVNNLSDFQQNAVVEVILGSRAVEPQWEVQPLADSQGRAQFQVNNVQPRQSTTFGFSVKKSETGTGPVDVGVRVVKTQMTGQQGAQPTLPAAGARSSNDAVPSVVSPSNNAANGQPVLPLQ